MSPIRVYFDNVITSGRVRRDLNPPAEMNAVDQLDQLHQQGQIKIVTSKMSRIEQARTSDPQALSALTARWDEVSVVQADHRVLGFNNLDYGSHGFSSNPMVTDIVDEGLFMSLMAAGLADADAKHVMYAVENACEVFVTLDTRDLLPHREAIRVFCPRIRILKPTELVAELTGQGSVRN